MNRDNLCPDCGAKQGELHDSGCDVERCPRCGGQLLSCNCIYEVNGMNPATLERDYRDIYHNGPTVTMFDKWDEEWGCRRMLWTGVWPGEAECIEFGWYSRMIPGVIGWQRCEKDDPGAGPDLNRLYEEAKWDADKQRFVRKTKEVK
jgi:Zn-finger nucleic acid-binding protein